MDMYLRDVILTLSWGTRKKREINARNKYQFYSEYTLISWMLNLSEGVPNETPEDSMVTMKRLASNDPGKIKDAIKAMLKEQRKLALQKQGKKEEEGAPEGGTETEQEAPVGEASSSGEEGPPKETQSGEAASEDPNDTQAGVEQVQSKLESTTEETSSGENIKGDEDSDVLKEFEKGKFSTCMFFACVE